MNVAEVREEPKEEIEVNNPLEDEEALMLKRVLVNTEKQVHEPVQRKVCLEQSVSHKVSVVKWLLIVVVLIIWFPQRW